MCLGAFGAKDEKSNITLLPYQCHIKESIPSSPAGSGKSLPEEVCANSKLFAFTINVLQNSE